MISSIASIIASVLAWAASKGIDGLIGKWVAYFSIAWEMRANDNARAAYEAAMTDLKLQMPDKYSQWEAWRQSIHSGGGST